MDAYRQSAKSAIRNALAQAYFLSQVHRFRHWGKVTILTYHRVLPPEELQRQHIQAGMYVHDSVFERHVQFLQEHFQMLSFQDLLRLWKERCWDDTKRYCVITFDDGWVDNYRYAYPILKKYGVPATIFLPTDYVGTHEWFWPEKVAHLVGQLLEGSVPPSTVEKAWERLRECLYNKHMNGPECTAVSVHQRDHIVDTIIESCKDLTLDGIADLVRQLSSILAVNIPDERVVMDWDEIAQMSRDNISFGSHSCSHRILTKLIPSEVKMELATSFRVLSEKRVNQVPVFCYPNGNTNAEIQKMVKDCGYLAGVGVERGTESNHPTNLYHLNRVSIHNDMTSTTPLLACHLLGPLH